MVGGARSAVTGLRSLPRAARRAVGFATAFVAVVTLLFVGLDAWQGRDTTPTPPPAAAPAPTPVPAPPVDAPQDEEPPVDEPVAPPEGPAAPGEQTPPSTGPAPSSISIQILNGIGADGTAAVTRVNDALVDAGFRVVARNTGRPYDVTTIFYTTGFETEARLVGTVLGVTDIRAMTDLPVERRLSSTVMVHLIVGADRR